MDNHKDVIKFGEFLRAYGLEESTIRTYTTNCAVFYRWYMDTYDDLPNELFLEPILEFLSYLKNHLRRKGETIVVYYSMLKLFSEFKGKKGLMDDVPYPKIQETHLNPSTVTQQEVDAFRMRILQETGKRNYCIVTILSYAGMRISETLDLKLDDINLDTREIIVRSGKGDKQRIVLMGDRVRNAISQYLPTRKKSELDYLFVSNWGNRIHRSTINRVFNEHSEKITPHTLRHFFCTQAITEGGMSLHELSRYVGHKDINTTMQYINPTASDMINKLDNM